MDMTRISRILYASDFSNASRRAFGTALTMARSARATLTVCHVMLPIVPVVPEHYLDATTFDRLEDEARRYSTRQLARLAARARKTGVRVATLVVQGDPAEQIVRATRTTRADLLVMGTHGRRGFSKFLLGSVAGRVVATARCPVVTVRER
jgi:nucleotide-binding universal stress UspA family protein